MAMIEQDRQIARIFADQRSKLRNFIRRRVPNDADVDDLLQEIFYELVRVHRLLMPIDTISAWLFSVARNRITDFFRKKKPESFSKAAGEDDQGEALRIEEMLPSPEAGPDAQYLRQELFKELEALSLSCLRSSARFS